MKEEWKEKALSKGGRERETKVIEDGRGIEEDKE